MNEHSAAQKFSALAQPSRLMVLKQLVRAGADGISAGALAKHIGAAPSALSFHLKELVNADLAIARREGRFIFYVANYDGLREIIEFLMADCCNGHPELCAPVSPDALLSQTSRLPPKKV